MSDEIIYITVDEAAPPVIEMVQEVLLTGPPGDPGNFVVNETPAGALNGSNATFTTANNFVPGSERVYINGLRIKRVDEYNTSGNTTIILVIAPTSTEFITVDYSKV